MADTTPMYNLKAVTNEVGLSPATLRAWERRYGLLKPKRTPGGHRLYSRQDIEMLKWLVEKQKEGLSISRAIEMWNRMQGDEQAVTRQGYITSQHVPGATETIVDELRQRWLDACLVYDDVAANQVLDQAFSMVAPETVCLEVLQKGLSAVGEGWYNASVSVQQEHFASTIASRRVDTLLAATIPPTRQGSILIACPPGEEHNFPLLVATYLLRRRGWNALFLGADMPLEDLDGALSTMSPSLVLSAAQTLVSAASLRKLSETIAEKGISFAYGGRVFNEIPGAREAISGHFLGVDLAGVPQAVENLLASPHPIATAQPISEEYEQALMSYVKNQALIATYLTSMIPTDMVEPRVLQMTNANLSRLIPSALILGDINYLDPSTAWLNSLLSYRGISVRLVKQFYATTLLAAEHYLGQEGAIILRWLKKQVVANQIKEDQIDYGG